MPDLRPRVPQAFWQRLQVGWRAPDQPINDFSDYQSRLLQEGIALTRQDHRPFASAIRDPKGHLKPRRKSLCLRLENGDLQSIREFQQGVYGGHDEDDVAVTFVRVALDNL